MMMRALSCCGLLVVGWGAGCRSDTPDPTRPPSAPLRFAGVSGGERDAGPTGPLPAAFKGYELYAWDESTGLEFTLITGTNREKSVAEITSRGRAQTGSEFVVVSGSGLQALERVLDRVPDNTPVLLAQLPGLPPLSEASRDAVVRLLDR